MTSRATLEPPRSSLGIAHGGTALITGAASGIGEAFARSLAARGVDLVMTGLPQERQRLSSIASELENLHGVRCLVAPADLAEPTGADRLRVVADEHEFEPDLLVNSAGIGASGPFSEASLEQQLQMIRVNVEGLVRLTGLYLPRMVERGAGTVINVASTAAFQPLPYFTVYAASKAFVLSFGEGLWAESRRSGVRVVNVCSGPVATPFHGDAQEDSADGPVRGFLRRRYMTTQRVVDTALTAVERNRPMVVLRMPVVGLLYYPVALIRAVLPLRVRLLLSERLNRWYFEQR